MEFVPVRSFTTNSKTVWSKLADDGELVVTNNGQPLALLIDLTGRDLVAVVTAFRQTLGVPPEKKKKGISSDAWLQFLYGVKNNSEVIGPEYDAVLNDRVNFDRELDL